MKAGDPFVFDVALFDASGSPLSYANKTAFTTAGWSLIFIDTAGAALASQPAYTLAAVAGVAGRHAVVSTLPAQATMVRITPPATTWSFVVLPSLYTDSLIYDENSIFSRLNSVLGISSSGAPATTVLPSMVEGDSYLATIVVPISYLARMGWSNLTGATFTGTIHRPADVGTEAAACVLDGTGTPPNGKLTINGSDPTAVDLSWTTFPTGMVFTTPERSATAINYRVEIQAVIAGKKLTILTQSNLTVLRQDNFV